MQKFAGKTVEESIEKACRNLKTDQQHLKYQVIQTPRHGFLGIGRRPAIIEARVITPKSATAGEKSKKAVSESADKIKAGEKPVSADQEQDEKQKEQIISRENFAKNLAKMQEASRGLSSYLDDVLQKLGIDGHLEIETIKSHDCHAKIATAHPNRVIGYHGRRINALEELGAAYLTYQGVKDFQFFLNCGDYRQRRSRSLQKLMNESITKVIASNRAVFLDPMPARERKLLHKLGADSGKVKTYSHGREPYRSVVIAPKS